MLAYNSYNEVHFWLIVNRLEHMFYNIRNHNHQDYKQSWREWNDCMLHSKQSMLMPFGFWI